MAKVFSRRKFFIAGGVGVTAAVGGGIAYSVLNSALGPNQNSLTEPQVVKSKNGLLDVTLEASYVTKNVGGKSVKMLAYNGSVPGPTLWLKPGDKLRIKFVNKLGYTTNLHTHGLHVSPDANGDNPLVMIEDGQSFQYEYDLPSNHPAGTFWYHPHHHGQAANQVFGGLYGAIVVDEGINMGSVRERVLVISDTSITTDGQVAGANMMSRMMGREGDYVLVNGDLQPRGDIDRGEERWHIVNACVSRNLSLSLDGASGQVIAVDGHVIQTPIKAEGVHLSPGNRLDVLVRASGGDVSLKYTSVPHPDSMGMMGSARTYSDYALFTLADTGKSGPGGMVMWSPPGFEDLRKLGELPVRTFELNMPSMSHMGGMMGSDGMSHQFTINGQTFDPNRVDETVGFGSVEEWTLTNKSTMDHPFHLHVWPMQILDDGSGALTDVRYQDVVNVPSKGQVKVRIRFSDFKGTTVYHCHILDHEDFGMMGIIKAS